MTLLPPSSTRTATLLPYTTLFRSHRGMAGHAAAGGQDALGRVHAVDALGAGLDPHQDHPLALARLGLGGIGRENHLRSEEHTSELKSLMRISYAVLCLKKKKTSNDINNIKTIFIIR